MRRAEDGSYADGMLIGALFHALALMSLLEGPKDAARVAGDVHVRVSPEVKTGIESTTEYPTIQMALDHHPMPLSTAGRHGRVFLHIAPGVYHERIVVTQNHPYVTLLGMGASPGDVVITNQLNADQAGGTFVSQTVEVNGSDFEADNVTMENTAGGTGPAVALALRSDRAVIKHCRILGGHHTLFADYGRQYYVDSYIEGDIHYIFGDATAVFERTELHSVGGGVITSHSRTSAVETTGYVVFRSKVTSAPGMLVELGDPWRAYARAVFIETELPGTMSAGWNDRGDVRNRSTAYFGEANNVGASRAAMPKWVHALTAEEVRAFLPERFMAGDDHWDAKKQAGMLP